MIPQNSNLFTQCKLFRNGILVAKLVCFEKSLELPRESKFSKTFENRDSKPREFIHLRTKTVCLKSQVQSRLDETDRWAKTAEDTTHLFHQKMGPRRGREKDDDDDDGRRFAFAMAIGAGDGDDGDAGKNK